MKFTDWLFARVGTRKWVVARYLTERMREEGYDLAIPTKRFAALLAEYRSETGRFA